MSIQAFERQVAMALKRRRGDVWWYHPPDIPGNQKLQAPADFIWGTPLCWGLLEVKETMASTLSPSSWSPHQRAEARRVVDRGGRAWLLVRFPQGIRLCAFEELIATQRSGREGIRHDYVFCDECIDLDHALDIIVGPR